MQLWNDYSIAERTHIAFLFRQLHERGKLPRSVLTEQLEAVKRGMTFRTHTGIRDGCGVVEPQMQFDKDPFLAREAKVALALLALAAQDQDGYRVLQCPHNNCGRLFIRSPTERGPKREAC